MTIRLRPLFAAPRVAAFLALAGLAFAAAPARAEVELSASYAVTVAGVTIGRAEAKARFNKTGYAAVVKGSTSGISRLVSDARASMSASGRIRPEGIAPSSYVLETVEGDFESHVRMSVQSGRVTELLAIPRLLPAPDRVPIEPGHRKGIVDPLAGFMIVAGKSGIEDGKAVCSRTIPVYDGWARYDLALSYKTTREAQGSGESYKGKLVVCAARYVPVAGHRAEREAVKFMASNKRIEISYAPIAGTPVLAPHRILIGTKYGDLVINATRFAIRETGSAIAN